MKNLLNEKDKNEKRMYKEVKVQQNSANEEAPTLMDLTEIIEKLKTIKNAGKDGITKEMFKYGEKEVCEPLHTFMKEIWVREKVLLNWDQAILYPVHKKGSREDCGNDSGPTLLNVAYKIKVRYTNAKKYPMRI